MNINIENKQFIVTIPLLLAAILITYLSVTHYRNYQDLKDRNTELWQQNNELVREVETAQANQGKTELAQSKK